MQLPELPPHHLHLAGRELGRFAQLQSLQIHVGKGFHLDRDTQGLVQAVPESYLAVLAQQTGQPIGEGLQGEA